MTADKPSLSIAEQILDLARWAPSGDNTQPWRFEIVDENHVVVHGRDTRDHCVYDLDGRPSQIAIGALLETIAIAATVHRLRTVIQRRAETPETHPTFDVRFIADPQITADSLAPFISKRSVQRRPLSTRALTTLEKQALERAISSDFRVLWLEGFDQKWRAARLMFANAKLRLTMREAYEVHSTVIQWKSQFSEDKVPDQAIGLDPLTTRLMGWVMQSWNRVEFFNTFLAGTLAPRIQLDLIPSLACAAHFVILAKQRPETIDDYIESGRAVQRFWLTTTQLGLQLQPEMTPLIFASYLRKGVAFTRDKNLEQLAKGPAAQFQQLVGKEGAENGVFIGRLGAGHYAKSRSLRRSLEWLSAKP